MSIKYDYGSSSKRFGVLDYKNAASAAGGPFGGGMGPGPNPVATEHRAYADPMGLVDSQVLKQKLQTLLVLVLKAELLTKIRWILMQ